MKKAYLYVFAQVVCIAGVVIGPFFDNRAGLLEVGKLLIVFGMIIILVSLRYLGKAITPSPQPKEGGDLVTDGSYSYCRHPIYTGLFFITVGYTLYFASIISLISTIVLSYVLYKKALFEEKLLVEKFGSKYEAYREKVKMFFPMLF